MSVKNAQLADWLSSGNRNNFLYVKISTAVCLIVLEICHFGMRLKNVSIDTKKLSGYSIVFWS